MHIGRFAAAADVRRERTRQRATRYFSQTTTSAKVSGLIKESPPCPRARFRSRPPLYEYLMQVGVRESPTAAALRVETAKLPMAMMQISPEQAGFMQMIVRLLGVKRALEVGTFTGYSALAVAEAMPSDGKLIACDVSEEWTSIGKRHWAMAGVAQQDRSEARARRGRRSIS